MSGALRPAEASTTAPVTLSRVRTTSTTTTTTCTTHHPPPPPPTPPPPRCARARAVKLETPADLSSGGMGGASTAVLVLLVAVVSAAAAVLVPIHAEDARPFGRASQLSQPDTLAEDGRSLGLPWA